MVSRSSAQRCVTDRQDTEPSSDPPWRPRDSQTFIINRSTRTLKHRMETRYGSTWERRAKENAALRWSGSVGSQGPRLKRTTSEYPRHRRDVWMEGRINFYVKFLCYHRFRGTLITRRSTTLRKLCFSFPDRSLHVRSKASAHKGALYNAIKEKTNQCDKGVQVRFKSS